jgi:hypothetical protein|tara:strand:+ start:206 stop:421 length:216 start_codon:yes stop_codon:yes gene_type:complete
MAMQSTVPMEQVKREIFDFMSMKSKEMEKAKKVKKGQRIMKEMIYGVIEIFHDHLVLSGAIISNESEQPIP